MVMIIIEFFTVKMNSPEENGIENFWSFAKRRLAKFNGCSSGAFALHLKECEFRYNHHNDDLFKIITQIFNRC